MVYARGNDIDSCGNEGEDENNVNGYGSSDNKSMQKLCVTS